MCTKNKSIIVFLLSLLTVACTKQWQETEQLDGFIITKYRERDLLDWGGSNSRVYRSRVCAIERDFCIEDKYVHIEDSRGQYVLISASSDHRKNEIVRERFGLYNKHTTEAIPCLNCQSPEFYQGILASKFIWSDRGDLAVVTNAWSLLERHLTEEENSRNYLMWLLSFRPEGVSIKSISPGGEAYRFGKPKNIRISPASDTVAWHLCDPNCALWQFGVQEESYTSTSLPCDYRAFNSYWQISWEGHTAFTELYWGGMDEHMCFHQDGTPAFPVQPM